MDRVTSKPPYRKLVSVRHISLIRPLDSSDTHEVVKVDGWPVVVGKGQFAANQRVLYFAIDCVLPLKDERYKPYRFSHFFVELQGQKGWVVQTVEYEGHISQGMVFHLEVFPEFILAANEIRERSIYIRVSSGQDFDGTIIAESLERTLKTMDFQKDLGIRKWITFYPPDGGISLGRSPSFLPTTKSERVQNIQDLWKTHGDTELQITEMLDGMPMVFYDISRSDDKYLQSELPGVILDDVAENGVRHRVKYGISIGDLDYQETDASISWNAVREQGITGEFIYGFLSIGLAGVLCGESISGNPHMIEGHRFYAYGVCDEKFSEWKTTDDHDDEWDGKLKSLQQVQKFSKRVRLSAFAKDLDELMKKAQGANCLSHETRAKYPSLKRKGLVFRALDGSFSFKVIANDWLLDQTEKLRRVGQDKAVCRPGPHECA